MNKGQPEDLIHQARLGAPSSSVATPPGAEASTAVALTLQPPTTILGVAWTWYAERVSSSGVPQMKDYQSEKRLHPTTNNTVWKEAAVEVEICDDLNNNGIVETGEVVRGPYGVIGSSGADSFSAVNYPLTSSSHIRYRIRINPGVDPTNGVLLSTPVFDDITIYYHHGVQYLFYSLLAQ
jgi:hypothetical protein